MRPKVSLVIPVYNVEKFFHRCINSVLNQTLKDIEIILVDDGSLDNCPALCDDVSEQDPRVKVIHKKNEGLGFARNSGMKIANGEYIAFIDSDDFIDVNMMKVLYEIAIRNHMQAVYCGVKMYDSSGLVIKERIEVNKYTEFIGNTSCREIGLNMIAPKNKSEYGYMPSVWHSIFNLNFLRANNLDFCSERQFKSEDIIFHIDFFAVANRVAFIPQTYYYYCYNGNSLSRTFNTNLYERTRIQYFEMLRRLHLYNYNDSDYIVAHKYMLSKARGFLYYLALNNISQKDRRLLIKRVINDTEIWTNLSHSKLQKILSPKLKLFYFIFRKKQIWIFDILNMITIFRHKFLIKL